MVPSSHAGQECPGLKTPTGVDLGQLFIDTVSKGNGQGFASYVWDKPGFDQPQPKISYLMTSALALDYRYRYLSG
jgi:methyl-accepting chemotaxis protein